MITPLVVKESEKYKWKITKHCYTQENPQERNFGKSIIRYEYVNEISGTKYMIENWYPSFKIGDTEDNNTDMYLRICNLVDGGRFE